MIVLVLGKNNLLEKIKGKKIFLDEIIYMFIDKAKEKRAEKIIRKVLEETYRDVKNLAREQKLILIISNPFYAQNAIFHPCFSMPLFKYFVPSYILVLEKKFENEAKILSIMLGIPYILVSSEEDIAFLSSQ